MRIFKVISLACILGLVVCYAFLGGMNMMLKTGTMQVGICACLASGVMWALTQQQQKDEDNQDERLYQEWKRQFEKSKQ